MSGLGAHEEDQDAPITEVVAARGFGRDRGARLRGMRRQHGDGVAERQRSRLEAPTAAADRAAPFDGLGLPGDGRGAVRRRHRTPAR